MRYLKGFLAIAAMHAFSFPSLALAQEDDHTTMEEAAVPPSGFLGDYSGLHPGPKGGPMLVYSKEEGVLTSYKQFILDPVLIYFHPEAKGQGVNPDELKMLADFLRDQAAEQLGKSGKYRLATEPGPGVARVRAAITDVESVDPKKNVGAKAAGLVLGVGLLVPSVNVGRASIEVEIVDSVSGERLVAIVDAKKGQRFLNVTKSAKTWGDAKGAFKSWAKNFRKRLDKIHGG